MFPSSLSKEPRYLDIPMFPDNIVTAYVLAACSRRLCLDAQMLT